MSPNLQKIILIILGITIGALGFFYFSQKKSVIPTEFQNFPPTTPTPDTYPTQNFSSSTPNSTITASSSIGAPAPIPKPKPKPTEVVYDDLERFTVYLNATTSAEVGESLLTAGFIKDKAAFVKAWGSAPVASGAYELSKRMDLARIVSTLKAAPYMKWIVITPGLRKEEIAEILTKSLGWTTTQKSNWINIDTETKLEYVEGVYFPDTYLIPVKEAPADVAKRIIAKFNENFSPLIADFNAQNIKWTSGLTLASIVEREAASNADKPLIAGILWNRLNVGMPLQVDATLQYVRGNKGGGYWAPISVADKKLDSPYNTYLYKGLPPHPIANPGLIAIRAVLNPAETDCIYYLHDASRTTHCAVTYEEHQANIEKYLK